MIKGKKWRVLRLENIRPPGSYVPELYKNMERYKWIKYSRIDRKKIICVVYECICKDNLAGKLAPKRKRVTHHSPLRLPPKSQNLAEIMEKTNKMKPVLVRMNCTNSFSSLECMNRIGKVCIWVTFIYECI